MSNKSVSTLLIQGGMSLDLASQETQGGGAVTASLLTYVACNIMIPLIPLDSVDKIYLLIFPQRLLSKMK
jgi:hypothetical protein